MGLKRWFGVDRGTPPPGSGASSSGPAGAGPPGEVAELRTALRALIRRVNAAAGRLPMGAVPEVRDVEDLLTEMLDYEERVVGSGAGIDVYEMTTITAVVHDYLPTSIDAYLALPRSFLSSHRNADGETPGEELLSQLRILRKGVADLAQAIYAGDAPRLSAQGRFLDAKFSSSDLDL
jgi:hypothetical protein